MIIGIIELVEADMNELNLLEACQSKPHYNLLSSIQLLLPYVKDIPSLMQNTLIKRILDVSFKAAQYAEPVVNSNSPEGFLPEGCFSVKGRQIWHTMVTNEQLCRSLFSVNDKKEHDATELAKQLLVMCLLHTTYRFDYHLGPNVR